VNEEKNGDQKDILPASKAENEVSSGASVAVRSEPEIGASATCSTPTTQEVDSSENSNQTCKYETDPTTDSDKQYKKKIEVAFHELVKTFPNTFTLKGYNAVCVDCKDVKIQLEAKNFLHNAGNHITCDSHKKAAKEKGASSSKRITSFFNPKPKSATSEPPAKKQAI
jgi:hypothetical protein